MKKFQIYGNGISVEREKIEAVSDSSPLIHCHERFELLYVTEGSGRCIVEGMEFTIRPRTLFVFLPFSFCSLNLEEGTVFEATSVIFDEKRVYDPMSRILKGFGLCEDKRPPAVLCRSGIVSDEIALIIERFESATNFPEPQKTNFLELLLSQLVLMLSMVGAADDGYDDSDLGARVVRYLNENGDRDISLDDLAKHFFVSKYHLCRAFKKHNGISVHGYINQKRVRHAKQLIEAGETASGAAYQVGFGDYSAFYRAYVKIIGKAPTASEKQNRTKG